MADDSRERWLPIGGYEGLYEVSDQGHIASLDYHKTGERVVLRLTAKSRYVKATLRDRNGKSRTYWIHRLVGKAFLPPAREDETQIDHINGNKQDNRAENLRWCTPKENVANPNTEPNRHIRYHREGEFERRSAGQRRRWENYYERIRT